VCQQRATRTHSAWLPRIQTEVAPRIDAELKMLGIDISERSVLRWMRKAPRSPLPALPIGHPSHFFLLEAVGFSVN
jgi:hypothetical protein